MRFYFLILESLFNCYFKHIIEIGFLIIFCYIALKFIYGLDQLIFSFINTFYFVNKNTIYLLSIKKYILANSKNYYSLLLLSYNGFFEYKNLIKIKEYFMD